MSDARPPMRHEEPEPAGAITPDPEDLIEAETPPPLDPTEPQPSAAGDAYAASFDLRVAEQAPLYAAAGRTLAWGFRITAALLAAGLLVALLRDESLSEEAEPLTEVIPLVLDGHAAGLVDLAIVAMVLTPVATVLVLATGFFRLGDRRYGSITLVVLAILVVSVGVSLLR